MNRLTILTLVAVTALAAAGVVPAATPTHNHASHAREASAAQPIASQLARARFATAKYVNDLDRAKADGYGIITRSIPNMGWHFLNPKVTGTDLAKPQILVYAKRNSRWQLVAFEWVFPTRPKKPPFPGATYGSFGAACHYADGTFEFTPTDRECAPKSPQTGAAFGFWHPDLVTLHTWVWYPNPDGFYSGTNPLMGPFNKG